MTSEVGGSDSTVRFTRHLLLLAALPRDEHAMVGISGAISALQVTVSKISGGAAELSVSSPILAKLSLRFAQICGYKSRCTDFLRSTGVDWFYQPSSVLLLAKRHTCRWRSACLQITLFGHHESLSSICHVQFGKCSDTIAQSKCRLVLYERYFRDYASRKPVYIGGQPCQRADALLRTGREPHE